MATFSPPPASPNASISPIPTDVADNFVLQPVSSSESEPSSHAESDKQFSFSLNWSANGDGASDHSTSPLVLSLSSSCSSIIENVEPVLVDGSGAAESGAIESALKQPSPSASFPGDATPLTFSFSCFPSVPMDSTRFVDFSGLRISAPTPKGFSTPLSSTASGKRSRRNKHLSVSSPVVAQQTTGASSSDKSTEAKRSRSNLGLSLATDESKLSRVSAQSVQTVLHRTPPFALPLSSPVPADVSAPTQNRADADGYVQRRLRALQTRLHELSLSVDHSFEAKDDETNVVSPIIDARKQSGETTSDSVEAKQSAQVDVSRPPAVANVEAYTNILTTLRELRAQLKVVETKVDRIPAGQPTAVVAQQAHPSPIPAPDRVVFYEDIPSVSSQKLNDAYKRLIHAPVRKADGGTLDWEDFESELDAEVSALHLLSKIKQSSL
jgi:hypothetical protein